MGSPLTLEAFLSEDLGNNTGPQKKASLTLDQFLKEDLGNGTYSGSSQQEAPKSQSVMDTARGAVEKAGNAVNPIVGATQVAAQGARALVDTVRGKDTATGEDASMLDNRSFGEKFKENYKSIKAQNEARAKEFDAASPKIAFMASTTGYALNPINKWIKGGSFTGDVRQGAAFATGEKISQVLDTAMSGGDVEQVLKDAPYDIAKSSLISGVVGSTLRGVFKSGSKEGGKAAARQGDKYFEKVKDRLDPDAVKVLENYGIVKDLGKKNVGQAIEDVQGKILEANKAVATDYDAYLKGLQEGIEGDAAKLNPLLEDALAQTKQAMENQVMEFGDAIRGKIPQPERIAAHLKNTQRVVAGVDDQVQHNFGVELDDIFKDKNIEINLEDVAKQTQETLKQSGIVGVKNDPHFIQGVFFSDTFKKDHPGVTKLFEKITGLKTLNAREAVELKQELGAMVNWDRDFSSPENEALKKVFFGVYDKLKDPSIVGKAADRYKGITEAYTQFKQINSSLKNKTKLFGEASGFKGDESSYFQKLESTRKTIESFKGSLGGLGKIGQLSDDNQAVLQSTLKQLSSAININNATKGNRSAQVLKTLAAKGLDASDATVRSIKPHIDAVKNIEEFKAAMKQARVAPAIQKAVENPFNKAARDNALRYIDQYAGKAKPELIALLDRAAKYERLTAFKTKAANELFSEVANAGVLNVDELAQFKTVVRMNPDLENMLGRKDVLEALARTDMNILHPSDTSVLKLSALATAANFGPGAFALTAAIISVPIIARNLGNPTALIGVLKGMEGKGLNISEKQIMRWVESSQAVRRAWNQSNEENQAR